MPSPTPSVARFIAGHGMVGQTSGVIVTTADRRRDRFAEPERGDATWFTLLSRDLTPTSGMSAGLAEFTPGGVGLPLHRHRQAEIYHIVSGTGALTLAGEVTTVVAGATVFIPGDAEHGIRNTGAEVLRVFYVFPTDSFSDVEYRFSPHANG